MEAVKNYFIQIVAVCMIAAIAGSVVKNTMILRVLRLVSGILILIVVIAPISKVDLSEISFDLGGQTQVDREEEYHLQFKTQVSKAAQTHLEAIARQYGLILHCEVTVSDDEIPIPTDVKLIGSPDAQQLLQLSEYIESQLGIPKERQTWRRDNG